jgi:hypothetical protein
MVWMMWIHLSALLSFLSSPLLCTALLCCERSSCHAAGGGDGRPQAGVCHRHPSRHLGGVGGGDEEDRVESPPLLDVVKVVVTAM